MDSGRRETSPSVFGDAIRPQRLTLSGPGTVGQLQRVQFGDCLLDFNERRAKEWKIRLEQGPQLLQRTLTVQPFQQSVLLRLQAEILQAQGVLDDDKRTTVVTDVFNDEIPTPAKRDRPLSRLDEYWRNGIHAARTLSLRAGWHIRGLAASEECLDPRNESSLPSSRATRSMPTQGGQSRLVSRGLASRTQTGGFTRTLTRVGLDRIGPRHHHPSAFKIPMRDIGRVGQIVDTTSKMTND